MTHLTQQIHNVETGEIIVEEFSDEETATIIEARENHIKQRQAEKTEAQAKKSVALSKLEALGLNDDDLKALGL